MKKVFLLSVLLLATTFGSIAQSYQEVVYLTDGSMIKGIIIEQVPDDYLKIETVNGKVYTIDMYDVEKITKERPGTQTRTQSSGRRVYNNGWVQESSRRQNNGRVQSRNQYNYAGTSYRNKQSYYEEEDDNYSENDYYYFPNKGYKGFIDIGYSYGTGSRVGSTEMSGENRFEFSTSHGILFTPYLFLGLGVGLHFYTGYNDDGNYYSYDKMVTEIPVFMHLRSHFIDQKVSPFVDVKLGYTVYEVTGTYFAPAVGCRFAKGSRSAFWLSIGYTIQNIDEYQDMSASSNAISMKIGWDF